MAGLPGTGASCGFSYGPCLCRRFYRGVPFTDLCSPEKMSGDHVSNPGDLPAGTGNGDLSDGTGPGGKRLGSGGRQGIDLYQVCSCHCRRDPSRF